MSNYITITAANIKDASGNPLASGTLTFQATDPTGAPLAFLVGGVGQAVISPVSTAITNGAIGSFQVANPAYTVPVNILYRVTVADSAGKVILKYSNVAVSGTSWNFDTYIPTTAALPPFGASVSQPYTFQTLTVTGEASMPTPVNASDAATKSYVDAIAATIPAAQVNSNWTASSGVAQILNKPVLGTAAAQNTSAFDAAGSAATVQTNLTAEATTRATADALLTPKTTTINGHALSSNVMVSASDLTTGTLPHAQLPTLLASDIPSLAESQVTGLPNALAGCEQIANKGAANGYAALDATGKLVSSQTPSLAITDTWAVASQAAMLALAARQGDVCIRSDVNETFILSTTDPTQLANWQQILTPASPVQSVNGNVGNVTLTIPVVGTTTPNMNGVAAIGSTGKWADAGHVHPTDTSRQAALGYTPVANTVTVNGNPLSSNVTVSASQITTGTLPVAQLPTIPYSQLSGTPTIPSVPITTIQNNGVAVTPSAGAINLIPGSNVTLTTSGDAITITSTSTASTAFSAVTGSTNTSAAMVVGSGASIATSGTGAISATQLNGTALSGLATGLLKNTTTTGVPTIAVAGTDYVIPSAVPVVTTTTPAMNGTATIGSSGKWADGGHIHPTDTSRAPIASPTFTGTLTAPTHNATSGYQVNGAALAASNLSNGTTGSGAVVLANAPTLNGQISLSSNGGSGSYLTFLPSSSGSWMNIYNANNTGLQFINGSNISGTVEAQITVGGEIDAAGNVVAYWSDRRLKEHLNEVTDWRDIINGLTAYRFHWNENGQKLTHQAGEQVGLIAQDVQKVLPQAVAVQPLQFKSDGTMRDDIEGDPDSPYLTVLYDKLIPVLVEAVKDLAKEVEKLKEPWYKKVLRWLGVR